MSLHESSIDDFGYIAPTPLPQHEWNLTGPPPDKSKIMDYGYVVEGTAVGCTARELFETVKQRRAEISFVWTPETPQPVRPEQVPFLTEAFRQIEVGQARNSMLFGAVVLVVGVVLALLYPGFDSVSRALCAIVGGVALAAGNWRYWRARYYYTQEDAISEASETRFREWLKDKSVSGYTIIVLASIILVSLVQAVAPDSMALSGLVKSAVLRGEVWRLFTAPFMHASFHHLLVVGFLVFWFSKIIEQTTQRAFVPLVFFVSAAVGSVFSMVFSPETTAMGGAGGLAGLVGFIVAAAWLNPAKFPPRYYKRTLTTLLSLGSVGLLGLPYIDNAAHLGGLLTGSLLGWLFTGGSWLPVTGKLAKLIGAGGVLALVSTAVFAISRMLS